MSVIPRHLFIPLEESSRHDTGVPLKTRTFFGKVAMIVKSHCSLFRGSHISVDELDSLYDSHWDRNRKVPMFRMKQRTAEECQVLCIDRIFDTPAECRRR